MSAPEDAGTRQIANLDVTTGSAKFEVSGILPGLYDLDGRINDPRGSPGQAGATNAWGRIPVDVFDRDGPRGIHPGAYKVFAWESVANGAWLNPVFISKVEPRGTVVHVTSTSTSPVEVQLIPRG